MSQYDYGLGPRSIGQIMAHIKNSDLALKHPYLSRPNSASVRMLPAMQVEILYDAGGVVIGMERLGDDTLFTMTTEKEVRKVTRNLLDVYALRTGFLSAETESEALTFLMESGGFRFCTIHDPDDHLLWSDFKLWQVAVRAIMSGGPSPEVWDDKYGFEVFWIDHETLDETIRTVPECMSDGERLACCPPRLFAVGPCEDSVIGGQKRTLGARITVFSPLEAILAATYLDCLNGIEYRLCFLNDCSNMYELNSKHERQYCSQACAHKASVRRRRAAAKAVLALPRIKATQKLKKKGKA
jgi:hypothetical protein